MTGYIDRSIIKLKRKFGKDELVAELNRQIREKDIELGMLKAEIDHLQAVQVSPQREIMKILGFENKLENCKISMEEIGDYHHAVNIHEITELRT